MVYKTFSRIRCEHLSPRGALKTSRDAGKGPIALDFLACVVSRKIFAEDDSTLGTSVSLTSRLGSLIGSYTKESCRAQVVGAPHAYQFVNASSHVFPYFERHVSPSHVSRTTTFAFALPFLSRESSNTG